LTNIFIYLGGRPRTITKIVENVNVKAVLVSFLPGNRGGEAIGEIIFGNSYPSAKFPITYPRFANAWTNYDVNPIDQGYRNELYPFGYGLSYTTFHYSDLTLSKYSVESNETLVVSVKVTNNGTREGKEVVILYLNDNFASISRPTKQVKLNSPNSLLLFTIYKCILFCLKVKRFEKILLQAGESKTVSFILDYSDYMFINPSMQRIAEVGNFTVMVENLNDMFRLNSVTSSASSIFVSMFLALITLIASIFNL
jgi:beta-glucosidase